jgi:antitoxin component YwqK of YwqJK toxin-antitoxin module
MKIFFATMVAICGFNLIASPIDDLTSPSPETREAAAKILRANYTPPPQTNWDSLLAELKVGDKKINVEAILLARGFKPSGGIGEQLESWDYKLNEAWTLRCEYYYQGQYRGNETLYSRNLFFSPEWRPVAYPSNYTGVWIEYYLNGQKCFETTLTNGIRCGDRTCYDFNTDGKVYVEHYDSNSPEVGWTQYYHSGSIATSGRKKDGSPIGIWTNYNEQGSIISTQIWSR